MMINSERPLFYKDIRQISNALADLGIIPEKIQESLLTKYKGKDLFDSDEFMADWYTHFTNINEDYVLSKIDKIDKIIMDHHI